MATPKTLFIDIENSAHLAEVWGLYNQDVGLPQLIRPGRMLCWSAAFLGEDIVRFSSIRDDCMLHDLLTILDEADEVVTWNGDRHDIPLINKEFLISGVDPPSPYRSVDLLKVFKKQFKFASNKLEFIAHQLGCTPKMNAGGHDLWLRVGRGDEQAWDVMEEYNKQDVLTLMEVYDIVKPWIGGRQLNRRLFNGECPSCGLENVLVRRGFRYTSVGKYQRYRCLNCGSWSTASKRIEGTDVRAN